ncbi:MAG: hypothetical protein ND866_21620 [Pyrinomonadaceae bacterium]|nr:hypothetical protein [Pyrinomonadaceae bacterium]
MTLQKDLREFIESLNALDVRFLVVGDLDGSSVPFISKEMLKRNKAACGRLQDLADL